MFIVIVSMIYIVVYVPRLIRIQRAIIYPLPRAKCTQRQRENQRMPNEYTQRHTIAHCLLR